MCIIITKEKGAKPIEKKIFENCWDNNPDGAGILYHDGKSSTLIKGIMKKEDFLQKVDLANKKECSFVIHTRIATHGSIKPDNTHPFVSKTLGFAHNGTMPVIPLEDKTDSESFFLWTIADKDMKWCKENKVSTGKVNVSSIAPKSKTNEPKVKIKKHKEKLNNQFLLK